MSEQVRPCRHMERMLNSHVDGKLWGFKKLYALAHLARCNRCRQFLKFIEDAVQKLREARADQAPSEVMARLASGAWREEVES